jgi:hypothetical protein
MQVNEKAARHLLAKMGYAGAASDWTPEKVVSFLNELPKKMDDASEVDGDDLDLQDEIVKAIFSGDSISLEEEEDMDVEVEEKDSDTADESASLDESNASEEAADTDTTEEEEAAEETKPKKKKKGKKAMKTEKTEKKTAPTKEKKAAAPSPKKKEDAKRDKFGCREGTGAYAINAAVGKKPLTPAQIAEKSGQKNNRVSQHLKWMLTRGYAEKNDKGYALASK